MTRHNSSTIGRYDPKGSALQARMRHVGGTMKLLLTSLAVGLLLATASCSTSNHAESFFTGGDSFGAIGNSAIQISPVTFNYGAVRLYTSSPAQTFTVTNSSEKSVYLSSIGSPSNSQFSISDVDCVLSASVPIRSGRSCTFKVTFIPTTSGQIDYGVTVNYNGGPATSNYSAAAALTGIGATDVVFPGVSSVDLIRSRSVRLNWTDVSNENGYALFVVNGGSLQFMGTVARDATSGMVTGLTANTLYTFRVRAFDYFGVLEGNTTDITATTLPDPILTPVADRTFFSGNPMDATTTLNVDINNTVTASDLNLAYSCVYDTTPDGSVGTGTACASLAGFTLNAGFAGVAGSVDGNGIFSFTPPLALVGQSFEFKITANDGSTDFTTLFKINVKAPFKYDATLVAAYQSQNANGYSAGTNSPFTSTWSNLATTGAIMDGTLGSGTFATGWQGDGTWIFNPFRLALAGTSGGGADRVIAGTGLNANPLLLFTSWVKPTNTALGSQAYVFGNRGPGPDGWSVRQRADGNFEFAVGTSTMSSYPTAITSLGPTAYFKMDALGGAVAYDEISTNNYTIQNNANVAKGVVGPYTATTGFDFTATGYINVSPSIDITAAGWAVAAWIKMPLVGASWKTLTRGATNDHQLLFETGTNILGMYLNASSLFTGTGFDADTLSAGWHHFAAVGTGGNTRFFVDGAFITQLAGMSTTEFSWIGNLNTGGQAIGQVDDVALFTSPLSDAQIQSIYLGGCNVALTDNYWSHLAGIFDGTTAHLYKDGTKVCDYTSSGNITGSAESFSMGAEASGSEAWPGEIGSVYVYNAGVGADITTNYGAEIDLYNVPQSCQAWRTAGFTTDGIYSVDIDGPGAGPATSVYCDMTTDSGGWMLVLNYLHQGGTNPATTSRATWPVIASSALGVDESGNAATWGHASPTLLNTATFTTMRFQCTTSGHGRQFDLKSSAAACKTYFTSGTGSCGTALNAGTPLAGHTGVTPGTALDNGFTNQGVNAMVAFPFYRSGNNHWGIRGSGSRWECDDYANNSANNTLHRIWIR